MTCRQLLVVLMLLSSFAVMGGCSGGGSSSVSADGSGSIPGNDTGSVPGTGFPGAGDPGSATGATILAWNAPATNEDGSSLTDLAGFKVYYGTSSGNYSGTVDVGMVTTFGIDNLPSGTYYLSVTAYNAAGNESDYSNEVTTTI